MAQVLTRRALLKAAAAAGAAAPVLGAGMAAGAAPLRRGGTLRIAEIGEPLTLDTVATTADLTTNITMPVFRRTVRARRDRSRAADY
jgi:ABC-type transport system substrate-binding protein